MSKQDEGLRGEIINNLKLMQISQACVEELNLPKPQRFKRLRKIRQNHADQILAKARPIIEKRAIDTAITAYESTCESLIQEAKQEGAREVIEEIEDKIIFLNIHKEIIKLRGSASYQWQALKERCENTKIK